MSVSFKILWTKALQALLCPWDFPGKNTGVGCLCRLRDWSLEKEKATHSGILAWEIPWREEPGELQGWNQHVLCYMWVLYHFNMFIICFHDIMYSIWKILIFWCLYCLFSLTRFPESKDCYSLENHVLNKYLWMLKWIKYFFWIFTIFQLLFCF